MRLLLIRSYVEIWNCLPQRIEKAKKKLEQECGCGEGWRNQLDRKSYETRLMRGERLMHTTIEGRMDGKRPKGRKRKGMLDMIRIIKDL